jgi:hypothetical protein
MTRVEVDRETMKPVSCLQNLPMMASQTDYLNGAAKVLVKNKEPKVVPLNGPAFDANELIAVIRRLPLAPGYKTTFSTFSAMSGTGAIKSEISVTGIEEIQTPAGKFQCYRVEVSNGNQTYWISTESSHVPVKLESGPMTSELLAIRKAGSEPSVYHNDQLGLSLTVPAGWMTEDFTMSNESGVQLILPGSTALVKLSLNSAPSPRPGSSAAEPDSTSEEHLRSQAEKMMKSQNVLMRGATVRSESWHTRQVSGYAAISWITDGTEPVFSAGPIAVYSVLVPAPSHSRCIEFSAKAEQKELEALQPQFDAIVDSLNLTLK